MRSQCREFPGICDSEAFVECVEKVLPCCERLAI
jgi:hypothetical protein